MEAVDVVVTTTDLGELSRKNPVLLIVIGFAILDEYCIKNQKTLASKCANLSRPNIDGACRDNHTKLDDVFES
jgi:hypothetical protein